MFCVICNLQLKNGLYEHAHSVLAPIFPLALGRSSQDTLTQAASYQLQYGTNNNDLLSRVVVKVCSTLTLESMIQMLCARMMSWLTCHIMAMVISCHVESVPWFPSDVCSSQYLRISSCLFWQRSE